MAARSSRTVDERGHRRVPQADAERERYEREREERRRPAEGRREEADHAAADAQDKDTVART